MPASNTTMIWKLQVALNSKGCKILSNRSQFYSEEQKRPVTKYIVSQSRKTESGKNRHVELFSSYSQIQIVLFMRNLWYLINDKPIPETNHMKGADEFTKKWNDFMNSETKEVLQEISNNNTNEEG